MAVSFKLTRQKMNNQTNKPLEFDPILPIEIINFLLIYKTNASDENNKTALSETRIELDEHELAMAA